MQQRKTAILTLEDGTQFVGKSFGYEMPCAGEVVFSTAMAGYPESLTDPSYSGQILVTTYPSLGNYGVPPQVIENGLSKYLDSEKIQCKAIICQDYSWDYSHWQATRSLSEWLTQERVVGLYGMDTRALTKKIRDNGSMLGKITFESESEIDFENPNLENLVSKVSCSEILEYGAGDKTVAVLDCGVKHYIIRALIERGVKVVRLPWNTDLSKITYDGLIISDGPGNPELLSSVVENVKYALSQDKPVFGICLGNELMALAAGAKTYKLKYGHRGHNQPVRRNGSNRCYITTQNHGYSVDVTTLPSDWKELYVNMNDNTNEGIQHHDKPFFGVQFLPEANGEPQDTTCVFDEFFKLLDC